MFDSISITSASATPTIDAIMSGLKPRDSHDDKPTTTTHPKTQPTPSMEDSEEETSTTAHPTFKTVISHNGEPTSTSKSSTHVASTTKESTTSKSSPTISSIPSTLSTKYSKSSSVPSSTVSFNPYPYPVKVGEPAPSQPTATNAVEKKLAALRKSNTDMGIVIAVFVICFVLMAAFQIWYWCVFKPKKKALTKGIELATGGKDNGRTWLGRKVAQKVVDRFV